ncbi:MAG TPA: hypothetical protein VGQ27_05345 [Steroidobacteraceae bacterium]|jgi:hypothetical protein|nr:hypothetical protein [Steroidobacteraceae bacterium]
MKNPGNGAKLLDASYAPEAGALLDELERTGQFRVGVDAELDEDAAAPTASADYAWGRGSGSVVIQDWWTAGNLALRVGPGISLHDLVLSRQDDSLVVRTQDGLDRVVLEGYLGLIPDASTLRVIFHDGSEWAGTKLVDRISSHLVRVDLPSN